MLINWRHPLKDPQPELGQKIWYIDWHWKQEFPGSFHIMSGTFERSRDGMSARVCECDEHGGGSSYLNWPVSERQILDCNYVGAWIPAEELDIPEWLKGNE